MFYSSWTENNYSYIKNMYAKNYNIFFVVNMKFRYMTII